jgi:hypothetical protein
MSSATITWDAVHTLLRLLGISNPSSFHQRPTECMFSFENGTDIEAVCNESEFLGYVVSEEGRLLLDDFITEIEPSLRNVVFFI